MPTHPRLQDLTPHSSISTAQAAKRLPSSPASHGPATTKTKKSRDGPPPPPLPPCSGPTPHRDHNTTTSYYRCRDHKQQQHERAAASIECVWVGRPEKLYGSPRLAREGYWQVGVSRQAILYRHAGGTLPYSDSAALVRFEWQLMGFLWESVGCADVPLCMY